MSVGYRDERRCDRDARAIARCRTTVDRHVRACGAGRGGPRGPGPSPSTRVARPRVGRMFWTRLRPVDLAPDGGGGLARRVVGQRRRSGGSTTPGRRTPSRRSRRNRSTYHWLDVGGPPRRRRSRSRSSPTRQARPAVGARARWLQHVEPLDEQDVGRLRRPRARSAPRRRPDASRPAPRTSGSPEVTSVRNRSSARWS